MSSPVTIWCDPDETLVATSEQPQEGWIHLEIGRWAVLRPGTLECLEALRKLGRVRLITYVPLAYARATCAVFDLGFDAADIFGQELWTSFLNEMPSLGRSGDVLIEDDRSHSVDAKCRFIGIERKRVVIVPPYGGDGADDVLASAPRRVQQLLGSQGAVRSLSACLDEAGTPAGMLKVASFLKTSPYPHYEADPTSPGLLIRIEENGTRNRGRFVHGQFEPEV